MALLGLGSSWLCGSDDEYGKLITGKERAYDIAGGVGLESLGSADLKLALMHQPVDWMQEFDKGQMSKLLAGKVDVLVRGHLHGMGLGLCTAHRTRRPCCRALERRIVRERGARVEFDLDRPLKSGST